MRKWEILLSALLDALYCLHAGRWSNSNRVETLIIRSQAASPVVGGNGPTSDRLSVSVHCFMCIVVRGGWLQHVPRPDSKWESNPALAYTHGAEAAKSSNACSTYLASCHRFISATGRDAPITRNTSDLQTNREERRPYTRHRPRTCVCVCVCQCLVCMFVSNHSKIFAETSNGQRFHPLQ